MALPSPYVANVPLQVALNLRYVDVNGDLVTQLYPDSYISLVGSKLSDQISLYNQVSLTLSAYNTRISTLEVKVADIMASGSTNVPYSNGLCLYNDNILHPTDDVVNRLVAQWCPFVTATGDSTAVSQSIYSQGSLNALPAYSQNSAMSGLSGWYSSPVTMAQSFTNLWLAYIDARSGITKAVNAVTPTCSQVIVAFNALAVSYNTGINVYFTGYTFIPTGYVDNGSSITVRDQQGNVYITAINIVTISTSNTPLNIPIQGTTLNPISPYTITVSSNVINSSINSTCTKTTFIDITNNIQYYPLLTNITSTNTTIGYTLYPFVNNDVTYVVQLLDPSGSTVLQTNIIVDPPTPQTSSFTGLTPSTHYNMNVKTEITGQETVTGPLYPKSTTA